jgi:small subunit ribosomal protein S10
LSIVLKSFNNQIILLFIKKTLNPLFKNFGISGFKSIPMPVVKKKITLNKSPHVFSKSKEQFELCVYSRLISVPCKLNTKNVLIKVIQILKLNLITGLSIEIKY